MFHSPLSRRALLGRMAASAIGLPFLQSLIPGQRLFAAEPAGRPPMPKRLCVVYVPHGLYMKNFLPSATGHGFPLSPTLQPLAGLTGRFSVVSNLMMDTGAGIMHHAGEMFLTNERIPEVDRFSPNRLSMDRLVVKRNEGQTLLPSLELSLSAFGGSGHRNTVSFDAQGIPLPGQHDPQMVFEQLYGSAADPQAQRKALQEQASILDEVTPQVSSLRKDLGAGDQRVLAEYLDSVRQTESYLQKLDRRLDKPTRPSDLGLVWNASTVATRMHNMFDLMFLAFQADLTRVISFVVFKERADGEQTYPDLGIKNEHHGLTHDTAEAKTSVEAYQSLAKIDPYHVEQLAYFLKRLRDTPEGDGSMLDNTLVLYGSGLSVTPTGIHDPVNLPLVLAGGEAMGIRQGQHVHYDTPTNLANLHLTLLRSLGVDTPQWKDSNRVLSELLV